MNSIRPSIYTIGHSTQSFDDFLSALTSHGIQALADVRRFPTSRRWPHFNGDSMMISLRDHGIRYFSFKSLGGRRKPNHDSINNGWESSSFRGYADYMQTPEFSHALEQLTTLAIETPTAIMCAERLPWRCHRQLISDLLLVRGWTVLNIFTAAKCTPHELTSFARVDGSKLAYPSSEPVLFEVD